MKKTLRVLIAAALAVFASACAKPAASGGYNFDAPQECLTAAAADERLREFLNVSAEFPDGDAGARLSYTESEKLAAERIESKLVSFGYEVTAQPFEFVDGVKTSRNIIAKKAAAEGGSGSVVIAANYDNYILPRYSAYGLAADPADMKKSAGAMDNGTGVAALLTLCDYYKDKNLPFGLVFLFAGAGADTTDGADKFVSEMSAAEKKSTLLAVNLRRFGGDGMYLYTDEVKRRHHGYILTAAADSGVPVSSVPKNIPMLNTQTAKTLPYSTYAMRGVHASFMAENIPVANIFSGNLNTANLSDVESKDSPNIAATPSDTYTELKNVRPDYARQMSAAAVLTAALLARPDFADAMTASRAAFNGYGIVSKIWILYLCVFALYLALVVLLASVAKRLEKKYPPVPPAAKRRPPVFGSEYEDSSDPLDPFSDSADPLDPFS